MPVLHVRLAADDRGGAALESLLLVPGHFVVGEFHC
jgi:hypothetical protein